MALDQYKAAENLLYELEADGLIDGKEIIALDLLDRMACIGLSFIKSDDASRAYINALPPREG